MSQATATLPARITPLDAARMLEVDVRAVHRMVKAGHLRAVPMPGGVKATIVRSSVVELLDKLSAAVGQAG